MLELAIAAVAGGLVTFLVERFLQKRARLSYFVTHDHIAMSGHDDLFGSVEVKWNGQPVSRLYATRVEMVNDSMRDIEDLKVSLFSNDTFLLTERTAIEGTAQIIDYTPEYEARVLPTDGASISDEQRDQWRGRREYLIPTLNRTQTASFSFLTVPHGANSPSVWMDLNHPGVKLQFRVGQNQHLGVPVPHAAGVGILLGVAFLYGVLALEPTPVLAAVASFLYGLIAQTPGALLLRAWRWARRMISD